MKRVFKGMTNVDRVSRYIDHDKRSGRMSVRISMWYGKAAFLMIELLILHSSVTPGIFSFEKRLVKCPLIAPYSFAPRSICASRQMQPLFFRWRRSRRPDHFLNTHVLASINKTIANAPDVTNPEDVRPSLGDVLVQGQRIVQ
jgi:hypothetical protein